MIDALRSAVWQLYQHRWSTFVCVLCLAVGIAVVSSTASIVDSVLLRPLPFHEPDELVMIRSEKATDLRFNEQVSRMDFWDWQTDCKTMDMTAFSLERLDLPYEGGFQRILGLAVAPSFFDVLQIRPYLGVDFRDYYVTGNWRRVMLSTSVWRKRYGGRSDVVGNMIEINSWTSYPNAGSRTYELTGLLPEGMRLLPSSSIFVDDRGLGPDRPLDFITTLNLNRGNFSFRGWREIDVLGRLKPGVSLEQAQAEVELICARLADRYPETNQGWTARVVPLNDYVFSSIQPFVVASLIAAVLVFIIAVANVIHILLVQFHRRQSEMAIRSALGATPWTLFRQVMLEFSLILLASLLFGVWIGRFCNSALMSMAPHKLRWLPMTISTNVVVLMIMLSALTGVLVWWIALRRVMSPSLTPLLGASGHTTTADPGSVRMLGRTTQVQLVATYFLMLAAGLLWMRTRELANVEPGFEPENRLTMVISLPAAKHEWNYNSVFNHEVIRRVRNVAGVRNAAVILGLPMGNSDLVGELTVEGRPLIRPGDLPTAYIRVITDDYFETMGIPLIRGRKFNATDSIGDIGVNRTAIVSQTMVDRCWPNIDPIGRRFKPFEGSHWMEVVGVVGDVHGGGIERRASIEIYYPEKLFPQSSPTLVVYTETQPMAMASQIRNAVLAADPDAHMTDVKAMDTVLIESQAERYFGLRLLSALTAIGIAMAGLGIVVTTMHSIASRSSELMIRVACGATPWDILVLVVQQHARVVGLAVGGGVLIALTVVPSLELPWREFRFFRSLALVVVPLLLTISALLAGLLVAGRMAFAPSVKLGGRNRSSAPMPFQIRTPAARQPKTPWLT